MMTQEPIIRRLRNENGGHSNQQTKARVNPGPPPKPGKQAKPHKITVACKKFPQTSDWFPKRGKYKQNGIDEPQRDEPKPLKDEMERTN